MLRQAIVTSSSVGIGVLVLVYAAFVSMGLPDGILGTAWPQMRAELGLGLNDNWRMLALGTCGSALSSFASGIALRRWGVGRVLMTTTVVTAAAILGYACSATFAWITALAFLLGLGNGAIDAGLNGFAASRLSTRHMSWLHGFWGVGVSLGTLTVSGTLAAGGTWRSAYLAVAVAQLALALAFASKLRLLPRVIPRAQHHGSPEHASLRETLGLRPAWVSIGVFFVYCGLECGAGLWIASVLHDGRGWPTASAGLMATLFWASLTLGRFLIGALAQRWAAIHIARTAATGALVGSLLVTVSSLIAHQAVAAGALTASGLLLTGLSLSPIYPMLMHDTARCVGSDHATNLIGVQGAAGQLGFALLPAGIGAVLQAQSTEWLGALLATLAATLLALLALREHLARTTSGCPPRI
jgi:fucose permease